MVNNAGIGGTENHGPVHELAEEAWDKVMNTNSRSVFLGCKFACAQFLSQTPHTNGHRGWIVNSSSIMGLVGQASHGGKYVCCLYTTDGAHFIADVITCSRLLCLKRSCDSLDEADRGGVCAVQDPL